MHLGDLQVERDSGESVFNLRTEPTGLADAVGVGYNRKNSVKKTPHFVSPWSRRCYLVV